VRGRRVGGPRRVPAAGAVVRGGKGDAPELKRGGLPAERGAVREQQRAVEGRFGRGRRALVLVGAVGEGSAARCRGKRRRGARCRWARARPRCTPGGALHVCTTPALARARARPARTLACAPPALLSRRHSPLPPGQRIGMGAGARARDARRVSADGGRSRAPRLPCACAAVPPRRSSNRMPPLSALFRSLARGAGTVPRAREPRVNCPWAAGLSDARPLSVKRYLTALKAAGRP
jgi:hypothetical protein